MPDLDVLTLPELAAPLRVGRKRTTTPIDARTRRSTATGGGAAHEGEQR
ncbi:MAG: hypothetical protein ABIO70_25835 [Pseudomonadota bacterium]